MSSSQSSPQGEEIRALPRSIAFGKAVLSPRGEKVRMRVFQQFAKNWTVTEINTRELGVTNLTALQ
jgi:hypothetical protein